MLIPFGSGALLRLGGRQMLRKHIHSLAFVTLCYQLTELIHDTATGLTSRVFDDDSITLKNERFRCLPRPSTVSAVVGTIILVIVLDATNQRWVL